MNTKHMTQTPPANANDTEFETPADLMDLLRGCPDKRLPCSVESVLPPPEDGRPAEESALGTPRAHSWDDAWLDTVNAVETRLGRRICGARTMAGKPCEFASTHPSGRCRFHGGFDLTGAPEGNRNAYIHGLYSRRLKTCGNHCPAWDSCPCAGPEILDTPLPDRPVCPYEQAQYNIALADALDVAVAVSTTDPFHVHIAHNVALLQVLLGRAALEMRNCAIVAETHAASRNYSLNQQQVNPLVTAIGRIGSELRKYHAMLKIPGPNDLKWLDQEERRHELREEEPGPDPQQFAPLTIEFVMATQDAVYRYITRAILHARENRDDEARRQWENAMSIEPRYANHWLAELRQNTPPPP